MLSCPKYVVMMLRAGPLEEWSEIGIFFDSGNGLDFHSRGLMNNIRRIAKEFAGELKALPGKKHCVITLPDTSFPKTIVQVGPTFFIATGLTDMLQDIFVESFYGARS